MSDLALYGVGFGMGVILVIVTYVVLWDEMVAGFKRLFEEPDQGIGQSQEPGVSSPRVAGQSVPPYHQGKFSRSEIIRRRLALGFNALAGACLLGVGVIGGQVVVAVSGVLSLVAFGGFLLISRRQGMI